MGIQGKTLEKFTPGNSGLSIADILDIVKKAIIPVFHYQNLISIPASNRSRIVGHLAAPLNRPIVLIRYYTAY